MKTKCVTCNIYLKYKFDWCPRVCTKSCREEDATTPMKSLIFITNFQGLSNVWNECVWGLLFGTLFHWPLSSLPWIVHDYLLAYMHASIACVSALHCESQNWCIRSSYNWNQKKKKLRQKDLSKAKLFAKEARREWRKFQKYFKEIYK